jgi:hypothetical protein
MVASVVVAGGVPPPKALLLLLLYSLDVYFYSKEEEEQIDRSQMSASIHKEMRCWEEHFEFKYLRLYILYRLIECFI